MFAMKKSMTERRFGRNFYMCTKVIFVLFYPVTVDNLMCHQRKACTSFVFSGGVRLVDVNRCLHVCQNIEPDLEACADSDDPIGQQNERLLYIHLY